MFMAAVPVQEDEEAGEPGGVGGSVEGSHRRWASRGGVATPLITFGFAAVLILFFVGVRGFETKALREALQGALRLRSGLGQLWGLWLGMHGQEQVLQGERHMGLQHQAGRGQQ
eukprot:CAMPEP_0180464070 /NCGR_PEP_ID=MMETSP1036_2-20121128/25254_1 /TAXON_ID=632150 /ORGANISM="Azadinium spinosum, Strain 3D9" /LENGTH=113 /DNA_ID=CAMNT_0022470909 /DNA_START=83 /DNA_END=423 /DNA_ORIENTATION=-